MPTLISKEAIKAKALELGLDAFGVTTPDALPHAPARLEEFLSEGRHGSMDWMEPRKDQRADPRVLWPEVQSIIAVGHNYGPSVDPLEALKRKERGVISSYARGKDYHDVLKKRLKSLARWMVEQTETDLKVFVDTAPVMEKPLAAAAGLGWQGKHTNLVSHEFGSWLFLGAIYTTLKLEPDTAHDDTCGTCRACLDICPTKAFPAPYQLDARRCISYLTIEHKSHIPDEFRKPIGNHIYGCEDCLAVCPWNKFAQRSQEAAYHARIELREPQLADLVGLDDATFREVFSGSPIKRTGRDRFVRNVLIAIGNSGDAGYLPHIRARLGDASPLVRAMAIWALRQLADAETFDQHRNDLSSNETDTDILREWSAAD